MNCSLDICKNCSSLSFKKFPIESKYVYSCNLSDYILFMQRIVFEFKEIPKDCQMLLEYMVLFDEA